MKLNINNLSIYEDREITYQKIKKKKDKNIEINIKNNKNKQKIK